MTKIFRFIWKRWIVITAAAAIVIAGTCGIVYAANVGNDAGVTAEVSSNSSALSGEASSTVSSEPISSVEEASSEVSEEVVTSEEISAEPASEEPEEEAGEAEISSQEEDAAVSNDDSTSSETKVNAWLDGYVPTSGEPGTLDESTLEEIKTAYADRENSSSSTSSKITSDNVITGRYYGTYNGYIVIVAYRSDEYYITIIQDIQIEDVTLSYSAGHYICAYKDGKFVDVEAAYANGDLSITDIKDMIYYSNLYYNSLFNK